MGNIISISSISYTTGSGGTGSNGGTGGDGGNIYLHGSDPSALLMSLPRANYARHDSGHGNAPLSCLEGTRVAILADIMSWLESAHGERPPVYLLSGLAGIGKSTIAKTVADRAGEKKMLGASFFFSRGDGPLCDPQFVFPTVAFQLALYESACNHVIMEAIKQDPTLGYQKLSAQFRGLVLTPLLKLNPTRRTVLIVLDALDDCETRGAPEILRLLFSLGTQIPFLRILITSRPEPHISAVFEEGLNHTVCVLHNIETSVIEQDIRFYLETELAKIPQDLRLPLGADWVLEEESNLLVEKSGKLFVYAATCIRFIGDDRMRDPRRHLHLILNTQTAQEVGATPYTQLDNLYMGVLLHSLSPNNRRDVLARFQVVVGSIVLMREPLPLHSLAQFLRYKMHDIDTALYHLRSIIIPPSNEHEAPYIYHPSFRDFIADGLRCSDAGFLIVPVPEQERRHAIRCFELLKESLKRDVAGISDPSLLNSEVDEFERKVREALSPEVQYACRYWASHLSGVQFGDEATRRVLEEFSMRSILWWCEAMSLIGSLSTAASSIRKAYDWAIGSNCKPTLVSMLADAHRFILAHGEVIRASALHVYQSALPFTPHATALYQVYCHEATDSIRVLRGVDSQWSHSLTGFLGHSDPVFSVAFSPDGSRLASGSDDRSVRLWDATSGACIAILKGHSDSVHSVAFSPDGMRMASASSDCSLRLWDAMSGASIATLDGHSDSVFFTAFSSDSLRVVSGSHDRFVRLWDGVSGASIATLEGHSGRVRCVAFSHDGLCLASGSEDNSVWLWDAVLGVCITTFKDHSGSVIDVAFSRDGLRLASGSEDTTVRLWDTASGAPIAILEGHSLSVSSVEFIPSGLRLASGSDDCSVRLWDGMSGSPIALLEGHSGPVLSIAFSPDGLRLVSGSTDRSVRLWDGMSGTPIVKLEGHSNLVACVAFSPDSLQLASGSFDNSVRLWDAMPMAPIAIQEGHSSSVCSVAFSPDGLAVASGSDDYFVRLWDARSGKPIATLPGHSGPVSSLVFSPNGFRLASGSNDHSIRLWDAKSGMPIAMLQGHFDWILSMVFSSDGKRLASCSFDNFVGLWDVMSGTSIAMLEGHLDSVYCVMLSPDDSRVASGSSDKSVRLWDAVSGRPIATLRGHLNAVFCLAFSLDGSWLASGSDDKSVRLWDAMSGEPIAMLQGHFSPLSSITFPTSTQVMISQSDAETLVWDLTSQPPCRLDMRSSVASHPFSADLFPLIWSLKGQWIQVQHPLSKQVWRICCLPPFYSPSTHIEASNPQNPSQVVIGCRDGHIIILDLQHHPLFMQFQSSHSSGK